MVIKLIHRGWHSTLPENTLESIEKTFQTDYQGIETDIQITKDNIWVLHHDDNLKRLFQLEKPMNFYNYQDIGTVFWKDKKTNFKLAKLTHLVKLAKKYQKIINLELKVKFSEITTQNTQNLKNIISNYKENIILSSFNWDWYPWCLKENFQFAHLIDEDKNIPLEGNFFIFHKNQTDKINLLRKKYKIGVYTLDYQEKSIIPFQIIDPPK